MGRHNPPAHPELLNGLADSLVASDFDLLPLIRGILLSDSFARSRIVTDTSSPDAPAEGSVAMFSRAYYRPVAFLDTAQALVQLTQPAPAPMPTPAADAPAAVLAQQSTLASQVTDAAATGALPAPTAADARSQQLTIGQLRLAQSGRQLDVADAKSRSRVSGRARTTATARGIAASGCALRVAAARPRVDAGTTILGAEQYGGVRGPPLSLIRLSCAETLREW